MLLTLMLADRKQLRAPAGSAAVSAADPEHPPLPCSGAGVALLIEGYVESKQLHLAASVECCGCAHPSPGQRSMKEYQSRLEEG